MEDKPVQTSVPPANPALSLGEGAPLLLMKHRTALLGFIWASVRDMHAAEDVFQELCLVVCQKQGEFRAGTNFLAWARSIAHRILLAQARKRARLRTADPETLDAMVCAAERLDKERQRPEARLEALSKCLDGLEGGARQLLAWRYAEGLGVEDVGRRAGKSNEAVYKALLRAREILRGCVERRLKTGGGT